jgi:hypothetical protein
MEPLPMLVSGDRVYYYDDTEDVGIVLRTKGNHALVRFEDAPDDWEGYWYPMHRLQLVSTCEADPEDSQSADPRADSKCDPSP